MKIIKSYIFIQGIRFYAFHGIGTLEKLVGQNFIVDIKIGANIALACTSDNVNDTVNYASVYDIIKEEMERPSQLLEQISKRIAEHLFNSFSIIDTIQLKITKQTPPMGADSKGAGVEIIYER